MGQPVKLETVCSANRLSRFVIADSTNKMIIEDPAERGDDEKTDDCNITIDQKKRGKPFRRTLNK